MAPTDQRPRWLVTGASGFLGANIGAFLQHKAHRIGVMRPGASPSRTFDEWHEGSLEQADQLAEVITGLRPDVVVHTAAMASHEACEAAPRLAETVNAEATGILARAAADASARFIYISTDAVFDGQRGRYSEDDLPNPTSVYGQTKLMGEQQAADATDALIVRTNFFGWSPTGKRSILEFFVSNLEEGRQIRGFTDFTTTSAYAQILADALHELVAQHAVGTFHVTSSDALTKYEFGVTVAEVFDLDAGLITPSAADVQPPRTGNIALEVSKVEARLGRALPTQRAGLERARADATSLRQIIRGQTSQ